VTDRRFTFFIGYSWWTPRCFGSSAKLFLSTT
jgi:hypothetical protein